jgi:hypothetical protein
VFRKFDQLLTRPIDLVNEVREIKMIQRPWKP